MKKPELIFKGVFSLLAILIGCAIVGWVLYNELIVRLPQFDRPNFAARFGIGPALIVAGIYWGGQVLQHFRSPKVVRGDLGQADREQRS